MVWIAEGIHADYDENLAMQSYGMDNKTPAFVDLRKKSQENRHELVVRKKQAYLDKLVYVRSQRLLDEEGKVLAQLAAFEPDNKEFRDGLEAFHLRQARELLQKKSHLSRPEPLEHQNDWKLSEDELVLLHSWHKLAEEWLADAEEDEDHLGTDLALLFYFFGDIQVSVQLLSQIPKSVGRNWLLLEFLYLAGRHVEGLELVTLFFAQADEFPEMKFSLMYFKARSLFYLGQKNEALDVLRQLLEVQPHYRNAERLLALWEGKL